MHLDGVGFQEAVAVLAGGKRPSPVAQRTPVARPALDFTADEERKRQRALQWWAEASPIEGTPAEQYLVKTRKQALPPVVSSAAGACVIVCWRRLRWRASKRVG
jgi:hypothetical protein